MIIPATASELHALACAAPLHPIADPAVLQMLAALAGRIETGFIPAAWRIVDGTDTVGLCSLTREPIRGVADIGYGIAPAFQGRGLATRAVAAVVDWARHDGRLHRLTAETAVHNIASQQVLRRNGFDITGNRTDAEDGELYCWTRVLR